MGRAGSYGIYLWHFSGRSFRQMPTFTESIFNEESRKTKEWLKFKEENMWFDPLPLFTVSQYRAKNLKEKFKLWLEYKIDDLNFMMFWW